MKKLLIILLLFLLICGCKKDDELNQKEIQAKYDEMKQELLKFAKFFFEDENWLNEKTEIGSYMITLNEISQDNIIDKSIFIDPITNEKCDFEKTTIKFIFNGKLENSNQYSYSFEPTLYCGGKLIDEIQ